MLNLLKSLLKDLSRTFLASVNVDEEWISDVETAEEGKSPRSDAWNLDSDYKSW